MPYDASNEKHVRKAERKAEVIEAASAQFLRVSLATIEGRAFFVRLLERCCIFQTPYTGNANATAFNCGLQSIGLALLDDIMRWCPDSYILMMKEREDGRRSSSPSDSRSRRDTSDDGRTVSETNGDYDPYSDSEPDASVH